MFVTWLTALALKEQFAGHIAINAIAKGLAETSTLTTGAPANIPVCDLQL